jgi:hypothetical protein
MENLRLGRISDLMLKPSRWLDGTSKIRIGKLLPLDEPVACVASAAGRRVAGDAGAPGEER